MTALVAVETLLLVFLAVLVAGLLRSHAEILRALENSGARSAPEADIPTELEAGGVKEPVELVGTGMTGEAVTVPVPDSGSRLLLAFLTSGCSTCKPMWRAIGRIDETEIPGGAALVIVTKDRDEESVSRLRKLAPDGVRVVMSSAAWESYRVPGSPYFVYVDGRRVRGEGSADSWEAALSFLGDGIEDALELEAGELAAVSANGEPRSIDGREERMQVG